VLLTKGNLEIKDKMEKCKTKFYFSNICGMRMWFFSYEQPITSILLLLWW